MRGPDETISEVCCQFLDERISDDRVDGGGADQVSREEKEEERSLNSKFCDFDDHPPGTSDLDLRSGFGRDDFAHALGEGGGVELGAENLVRAVGHDGDAPIANEGDELAGLSGFDL